MMSEQIKELLKLAARVVGSRSSDISTEDGDFATVEVDKLLRLEYEFVETFNLPSDAVCTKTLPDLLDKIDWRLDQDKDLEQQNQQLKALVEKLKQEARIHASEDDTHKATQLEIYQALNIQKGDWNGAVPVIERFNELKARVAELEANNEKLKLALSDFVSNGSVQVNFPSECEYGEHILEMSRKQSLAQIQADAVEKASEHLLHQEYVRQKKEWEDFVSSKSNTCATSFHSLFKKLHEDFINYAQQLRKGEGDE
jgi:hypothetical protein